MTKLHIHCDTGPLDKAIAELLQLSEGRPELVKAFVDRVDSLSKLVSLDLDVSPAPLAGDCRVLLQPTDCFLEFLAAARAGNFKGL